MVVTPCIAGISVVVGAAKCSGGVEIDIGDDMGEELEVFVEGKRGMGRIG